MSSFAWFTSNIITGFFGDLGLQYLFPGQYGLGEYYKKHGELESMFIAAGMMGYFAIFPYYFGFFRNNILLFLYGMGLDFLFCNLVEAGFAMTSLRDYYRENSYLFTMMWGGLTFSISGVLFYLIEG